MWFYPYVVSLIIGLLFVVNPRFAHATMDPPSIANACNALAIETFGLKDLVLTITNSSKTGAGMKDVFNEFDNLFEDVLDNIGFVVGSQVIPDQADQQLVYQGYSYFVQAVFELMDGLSAGATAFITLDSHTKFRIPLEVQALGGVVDAYFFNIISVFPSNSSYYMQSNNQKDQVDTHFRQAVQAFDLATANTTSARRRL